jgi:dynein heavy chain 2
MGKQMKEIEEEMRQLNLRLLTSDGFLVGFGRLNETDRNQKLKPILNLVSLSNFNPHSFLYSETEILEMKYNGFSSDELSTENAVIIHEPTEKPLFVIDPTDRVVEWLENDLCQSAEILSSGHTRFQPQIPLVLRFGGKLVIREANQIHLCLYPYLNKSFVSQNDRNSVLTGDKLIDVHPDFRLIFISRNSTTELISRGKSM